MQGPDPAKSPETTGPSSKTVANAPSSRHPAATPAAEEVARLLDAYLADLEAGRSPDRERLLADHPELADALNEALAGLEFIHAAAPKPEQPPAQLGDFRIVREVGRGGMGVVYEAEQISLKRRVALKVLRFGPVADPVAMQRFQREAETVGRLHHTNIVPIFAIGEEQGVRYYAMQFIEGRDLGRIGQESRAEHRPLDVRSVAAWGIQAADALAHAHQRGVIHRDIKPSNLILDPEDRIWLTDFGLARRLDDVSLSLTGALLGTPRYMSPEQAESASRPIDHRTDIYSLGATLYELLAGRPIFEADTPHEVLARILHEEPRALRQFVPGLPRDLETIILKCLAKDPARRYATALALAEDLRAFAAGRSILARRPTWTERSARWVARHRRSVWVGSASAVASLVVAALGVAGTRHYRESRLAKLHLDSSQPGLMAEVLDTNRNSVTPHFPVPLKEPLRLPAGAYQLRVSASGLLSESWPLELAARAETSQSLELPSRWLWPPREIAASTASIEVVEVRDHADLLVSVPPEVTPGRGPGPISLRLVDGATGKPVWPRDLTFDAAHAPAGTVPEEWQQLLSHSAVGPVFSGTGIAQRVNRLDADDVGDVVLVSRSTPSLLAVSGADGRLLWWHRGRIPGTNAEPAGTRPASGLYRGFVVGSPIRIEDVDADGVPDFAACFRSNGEPRIRADGTFLTLPARSWISVVSGRTGALIWQDEVAEDWSDYSSSSEGVRVHEPRARLGSFVQDGRRVLVLPEKNRLRFWNAADGGLVAPPVDAGFPLAHAPRLVEGNGPGGGTSALLLRATEKDAHQEYELVALDLPSGTRRWQHAFQVLPGHQHRAYFEGLPNRIVVADLDGDGRPEIATFAGRQTPAGRAWFGVELLDGSTGERRWESTLFQGDPFQYQAEATALVAGPDVDGDGRRELFASLTA